MALIGWLVIWFTFHGLSNLVFIPHGYSFRNRPWAIAFLYFVGTLLVIFTYHIPLTWYLLVCIAAVFLGNYVPFISKLSDLAFQQIMLYTLLAVILPHLSLLGFILIFSLSHIPAFFLSQLKITGRILLVVSLPFLSAAFYYSFSLPTVGPPLAFIIHLLVNIFLWYGWERHRSIGLLP